MTLFIISWFIFLAINVMMTHYIAKNDGYLNPFSIIACMLHFIGALALIIILLCNLGDKYYDKN